MRDPRLDKLAQVLVRYSVAVRPGDVVFIKGSTVAEPLAVAVLHAVLRAGGHPWVRLLPEDADWVFLRHASENQLAFVSPIEKHIISTVNVYISFWGTANTRALSNIDPKKQVSASRARQPILRKFMKRAALPPDHPKRLRWVGTAYPCHASAQEAEMSLPEWADFVFRAGKLDRPDPIAAWKHVGVAQQRLADHLNRCRELHIRAPNGTDIRFGIAGRRWINCQGHENFPDGEVFTAPIEDATEGVVVFSYPAVYDGREVENVRLKFRAGRVVDASAGKNEEFLIRMIDQDRGARVLGELALGTNYDITRYVKDTLFDEKIGGTFHTALGAAYPESGGLNQSGLHWDMVCDLRRGGVVEADGRIISRNGRFTNPKWPHA